MFSIEGNGPTRGDGAPAPVSHDFNRQATGGEIQYGLNRVMASLRQAATTDEKIVALNRLVKQTNGARENAPLRRRVSEMREEILPAQISRMCDLLSTLSDPEAPDIGKTFVREWKNANPKVILDSSIPHRAHYIGYSFQAENHGLAREYHLKEDLIENLLQTSSSLVHESLHDHQIKTSASRFSPYNPDTKIMIHPLDWIMFATLLERDAHAKEAFFNSLLGRLDPSVYANTKRDLVTASEFVSLRASSANLQEALIKAAAISLEKDQNLYRPGPNFVDHYAGLAIACYKQSMDDRNNEGQSGFVYVRLSPHHFWEIGNYGIGPNTLGEHGLDPRFMWRPRMSEANKASLDKLCRDYAIPSHQCCLTLDEVLQVSTHSPNVSIVPDQDLQQSTNMSFGPALSFAL